MIDRFGYCKSLDEASYSRLAPETIEEYTHIIPMKNTGKLCVFSATGFMYQIKAMSIPKVKNRDKGVLVQSLCKIGKDDVITYIAFEDLFESQLLFVTKSGYVKLVSGTEFETNRTCITSTKLEEEDMLVCALQVTVEETLDNDRNVIIATKNKLYLAFPLNQISELKKTSKGLKGITLAKDDYVEYVKVITPDIENIEFDGKRYNIKKIKVKNRNEIPSKLK